VVPLARLAKCLPPEACLRIAWEHGSGFRLQRGPVRAWAGPWHGSVYKYSHSLGLPDQRHFKRLPTDLQVAYSIKELARSN